MSEKKYSLQELLDLKDLGSLGEAYRRMMSKDKQPSRKSIEKAYKDIVPGLPSQCHHSMEKFSMVDYSQKVALKTSTA